MKLSLFIFVALATSVAAANDGYAIDTGSAVNFSRSPHVQMASEDIRIWLDDERARVEVDFVFKNYGPRHTLTMGFPDNGYNIAVPTMENPKSWVDGKPTPLKYRRVEKTGDEEDSMDYGVWTKPVTFGKNQTRRVRFSYRVKHTWNVSNEALASYILRTGATWRGPINEAKVTVDWSKVKKRWTPMIVEWRDVGRTFSGPEWKYGDKRATRVYRNFVPDFDLHFEMNPSFRYVLLNGDFMGEIYPRVNYIGDPKDIEIAVSAVPKFFQNLEDLQPKDWGNPVTRFFGGSITFTDSKTMLLGGRRKVTLKRPTFIGKGKKYWSEDGVEMVYLRDMIQALGGSYSYNARSGRLDLRIPAGRR